MAQDAFERAFGGLARFNGDSSFGTWVQRSAVNRTIDQLRRERRLGELTGDLEDPVEYPIDGNGFLLEGVSPTARS